MITPTMPLASKENPQAAEPTPHHLYRPKKISFKKIIFGLFLVAILLSGGLSALILYQRNADVRQQASEGEFSATDNPITITLQPEKNNAIYSNRPEKSAGTSGASGLWAGWEREYGNERFLLKFNLSNIPSDALVVSAKLILYNDDVTTNGPSLPISVHKITQGSWDDATLTWNSAQNIQFHGLPEATIPVDSTSGKWVEWDISPLTREWATNPSSNLGIVLKAEDLTEGPRNDRGFWSTYCVNLPEHASVCQDKLPKLEIVYTAPAQSCSTLTAWPAGTDVSTKPVCEQFIGSEGIQLAVDLAPDNATVLIKNGVYENVNIKSGLDGHPIKTNITITGESNQVFLHGRFSIQGGKHQLHKLSITKQDDVGSTVLWIKNCEVSIKELFITGPGVGIYTSGTNLINIDNSLINKVREKGIFARGDSVISLTNSVISNVENRKYERDAAISQEDNSFVTIKNSIIAHNPVGAGIRADVTQNVKLDHSLLFDNGSYDADTVVKASGPGNIFDQDPKFADRAGGDFHLLAGSLAMDNGDPAIFDQDCSRSDMGIYGGGKTAVECAETGPSPTPQPSGTPQNARLTFPFKLQGLNKAGVEIAVKVLLQAINPDGSPKAGGRNLETDVVFRSNAAGWLTPASPINLAEIAQANLIPQRYRILVKTPVSLRKEVGRFELTAVDQAINLPQPIEIGGVTAKVGDFLPENSGNNILNVLDIGATLREWTALSVPLTSANRRFDVNYDNIINLFDINLVLSNWTALTITGD